MDDEERKELQAYRQATHEVGAAGWNTCMMYIQCRVRQIMNNLPEPSEQNNPCKQLEENRACQ